VKILMLGWEFPPKISGGLGTACEGLTRGLSSNNVDVSLFLPRLYGDEQACGVRLIAAFSQEDNQAIVDSFASPPLHNETHPPAVQSENFVSGYARADATQRYEDKLEILKVHRDESTQIASQQVSRSEILSKAYQQHLNGAALLEGAPYGENIFQVVEQFAAAALYRLHDTDVDVIHAHDWMTFPAAVALKQLTGKPLIVHVHSLEFDRSGSSVNPDIDAIERFGLEHADKVVAVSHYTSSVIQAEHGIDPDRIAVIHNGIYPREVVSQNRLELGWTSKVVLFLGRVTFQKGPDYLVEAAAKVLQHVPDATFVIAGTGDMLNQLKARVGELGIEKNFYFPGFLSGKQLEQVFSTAEVYVMPSVSEPFGISALEAISFDTPVVISKQSGVSEVLHHALKVDFWDIDQLADLIISALEYPELRADLVSMAREEVKRLHWDASAKRTVEIYQEILGIQ
jgi:glycosyltransferase involved in cell wall biosynthesis